MVKNDAPPPLYITNVMTVVIFIYQTTDWYGPIDMSVGGFILSSYCSLCVEEWYARRWWRESNKSDLYKANRMQHSALGVIFSTWCLILIMEQFDHIHLIEDGARFI